MLPYFTKKYGNASEYHRLGMEAKMAVADSRKKVAEVLGAKTAEIVFTSSATESINLSHKGLIENLQNEFKKGERPHVITTKIEHKAVLETLRHMERKGEAQVTYLDVNKRGLIDLVTFKKAIKAQTVLVTIIYVNNEIGTIQPIKNIGKYLKEINKKRKRPIYFHTDATQAINYLDCRVNNLNVDLLSLTGHKINAPKGIGALYVREGVKIIRQMDGGGQEKGLRSGTENVPYIVGIGKALQLTEEDKIKKAKKVALLRDRLIKGVLQIPGVSLTGDKLVRSPHIASFLVDGVEGEAMILALSELGIIASTGSACSAADLAPSHVLTALGIPPEKSHGSLRFSLGKETTPGEIDLVIKVLPGIIKNLRVMAPKF